MDITKKGWKKNVAIVIGVSVIIAYLSLFFQRGTCLYGGFKKIIKTEKGFEYHFKYLGNKVDIVVDNTTNPDKEINIKYVLDGKYDNEYKVTSESLSNVNNEEEVKVFSKVFSNEKLLFSGIVHEFGSKPVIVNEQTGGEKLPMFNDMNMDSYNGGNVDVRLIITTALGFGTTFRGNFIFLIIGLINIGLGYFRCKHPRKNFNGTMVNFYVKNPEPTEDYITYQKIYAVVVCIIGIGFMIAGLFVK